MNAIEENLTPADQTAVMHGSMVQVINYLPPPVSRTTPYEPIYLKYMLAVDLFRDNDYFFNKYVSVLK